MDIEEAHDIAGRRRKAIAAVMVLLGKWEDGEPNILTMIRNNLSPVAPDDPMEVLMGESPGLYTAQEVLDTVAAMKAYGNGSDEAAR